MEVLDAVRPSLKLADDFPVQAIPLDTVKAVKAVRDWSKALITGRRANRKSAIVSNR